MCSCGEQSDELRKHDVDRHFCTWLSAANTPVHSFDFWRACVAEARGLGPGREGDKCQLFYHLFGFLKEYEPECLNTGLGRPGEGTGGSKIRRGSWKEQERQKGLRVLSEMAKEVGDFPGDVFANKAVEGALKGMFGFASGGPI